MKNIFAYLLAALFMWQCTSKAQENNQVEEDETELKEVQISLIRLTAEGEEAIISWKFFKEFENDLKAIDRNTVKEQSEIIKRMSGTSDSLLKYTPGELANNIILSRAKVLNVRVKLLDQLLNQPRISNEKLQKNMDETTMAYNNLVNQINEKIEKEHIDQMTQTDANIENFKKQQANDTL